jgi:hypothetical protein
MKIALQRSLCKCSYCPFYINLSFPFSTKEAPHLCMHDGWRKKICNSLQALAKVKKCGSHSLQALAKVKKCGSH